MLIFKKSISWLGALFACVFLTIVSSSFAFAQDDSCPEYAVYHTTTPQRPATSDKYLQAEKLKDLEPKDADVILLGDSLTSAWKTKDLQKKLTGLKVLNLGIGSDRTQQIIWRLNQLNTADYKPKYIVLWIGTNNLRTDPACAISKGIVAILDIITASWKNSEVIVLETPPRGLDFSAYMPERLEIYDAAKAKFRDQNVSFLNVDDELTCGGVRQFSEEYHIRAKVYKKVPSPCVLYKRDLLHLTKDGYEVLSGIIADVIKTNP